VTTDPYSPELGDWRLSFTGWATGSGNETWDKPLPVSLTSVYRDGVKQFSFQAPSPSALQLDFAWSCGQRAEAIRPRIHLANAEPLPGRARIAVAVPDSYSSELYDCLQEMMGSAFFSFAAIESYCNQVIAERSKGPIEVRRKKNGVEHLPASVAVERLSTDSKLKDIVPKLLGTPSISGRKEWQLFLSLKHARDGVTHFKRHDVARSYPVLHEPTALFRLYRANSFEFFDAAIAVLSAIMPTQKERWLLNPRWNRTNGPSTGNKTQQRKATREPRSGA